jgi:hypothetical protein
MGMTIESNKLLIRKFTEFINSASKQMAEELISPKLSSSFRVVPSRWEAPRVISLSSG